MKRQNKSLEKSGRLAVGMLALLLSMSLCACGSTGGAGRTEPQAAETTAEATSAPQTTEETAVSPSPTAEPISTPEPTSTPEPEETAAETPTPEPEGDEGDTAEAPLTGIRPEFQATMDSYEAFYDEYCTLLEQYQENPTDLGVLAQYTEMMSKLAEMDEAFDAWDDEEMSNEELAYYLEVSARIQQRLAKVVAD